MWLICRKARRRLKISLGYDQLTMACPNPLLRPFSKTLDEVSLGDKLLETWSNFRASLGSAQASVAGLGFERAGDGLLNSPRHQVFWKLSME